MLSRLVLQRTASLPSRNSVKEQEATSTVRAPFHGILIPNLMVSFALLQWFLKLFQDGLKASHVPEYCSIMLLFLLPATAARDFAFMQ